MKKNQTFLIGNNSVSKILTRLTELGLIVSIPFGEGYRYDLLADDRKKINRVQVKTGKLLDSGSILFRTSSSSWYTSVNKPYTENDIDVFAIYCPQNDKCYWVPVGEVGNKSARLRVYSPRNNASKNIRWAKDFEI